MNIEDEFKKLISTAMDNEKFEHFMNIAQEISKNYSESKIKNVTQQTVKLEHGTQNKTIYNKQYQYEQAFMVMFYHKYANMINKMKTPAEIGDHVKTASFLTPAYYNTADKKISYKLGVILREKSDNFANVMELCFHENRHAMQFKAFDIGDAEELIDFDSNSILIFKDFLTMQNVNYQRNHINSLIEIDANLYARGISKNLIAQYFPEHQDDLEYTDFARKEEITDNPFEEISELGSITGEYVLENGEKIDRVIMMDKNLRNMVSPQLVEQYPILKLIWIDGNFKTYSEIMEDKQTLLQRVSNEKLTTIESPSYNEESITKKEKVERLYSNIIKSDPMLYLESLLSRKQIGYRETKNLFIDHPALLKEYQDQITEIFSRKLLEIDDSQINYFNRLADELNIKLQSARARKLPMEQFVKNALNNGARTGTVKEANEQMPTKQAMKNDEEQQANSFADLDEFVDFIDPKLINDTRFLSLLRKYKRNDMHPEDYVEWMEMNYKKENEQTDEEQVDQTEDGIR